MDFTILSRHWYSYTKYSGFFSKQSTDVYFAGKNKNKRLCTRSAINILLVFHRSTWKIHCVYLLRVVIRNLLCSKNSLWIINSFYIFNTNVFILNCKSKIGIVFDYVVVLSDNSESGVGLFRISFIVRLDSRGGVAAFTSDKIPANLSTLQPQRQNSSVEIGDRGVGYGRGSTGCRPMGGQLKGGWQRMGMQRMSSSKSARRCTGWLGNFTLSQLQKPFTLKCSRVPQSPATPRCPPPPPPPPSCRHFFPRVPPRPVRNSLPPTRPMPWHDGQPPSRGFDVLQMSG